MSPILSLTFRCSVHCKYEVPQEQNAWRGHVLCFIKNRIQSILHFRLTYQRTALRWSTWLVEFCATMSKKRDWISSSLSPRRATWPDIQQCGKSVTYWWTCTNEECQRKKTNTNLREKHITGTKTWNISTWHICYRCFYKLISNLSIFTSILTILLFLFVFSSFFRAWYLRKWSDWIILICLA